MVAIRFRTPIQRVTQIVTLPRKWSRLWPKPNVVHEMAKAKDEKEMALHCRFQRITDRPDQVGMNRACITDECACEL